MCFSVDRLEKVAQRSQKATREQRPETYSPSSHQNKRKQTDTQHRKPPGAATGMSTEIHPEYDPHTSITLSTNLDRQVRHARYEGAALGESKEAGDCPFNQGDR